MKKGSHRQVIILNKVVIKLPRFHRWRNFILGLLGNINERDCWKYYQDREESKLLCPVIWTMWGGFILIMKRADTKAFKDWCSLQSVRKTEDGRNIIDHNIIYSQWIEAGLEGDDKQDNYGMLKGLPVKIDYGSLDRFVIY